MFRYADIGIYCAVAISVAAHGAVVFAWRAPVTVAPLAAPTPQISVSLAPPASTRAVSQSQPSAVSESTRADAPSHRALPPRLSTTSTPLEPTQAQETFTRVSAAAEPEKVMPVLKASAAEVTEKSVATREQRAAPGRVPETVSDGIAAQTESKNPEQLSQQDSSEQSRQHTPEKVAQPTSVPAVTASAASAPPQPVVEAVPMLSNPPPRYPRLARRKGQQGRVVLRVAVSDGGTADSLRIVTSSGYSTLDRAALEAVKKWRFEPARKNGRAVRSNVNVPVVFKLEG